MPSDALTCHPFRHISHTLRFVLASQLHSRDAHLTQKMPYHQDITYKVQFFLPCFYIRSDLVAHSACFHFSQCVCCFAFGQSASNLSTASTGIENPGRAGCPKLGGTCLSTLLELQLHAGTDSRWAPMLWVMKLAETTYPPKDGLRYRKEAESRAFIEIVYMLATVG